MAVGPGLVGLRREAVRRSLSAAVRPFRSSLRAVLADCGIWGWRISRTGVLGALWCVGGCVAGGWERRRRAAPTTLDVKRGALVPVSMRGTIGQRSSGILPCPRVFADGASVCARVASHQLCRSY